MDGPLLQKVTDVPSGDIEQGRAHFRLRAWGEAYDTLARADRSAALAVEDVERLAWSAALTGRDAEMVQLLERSYQIHLGRGEEIAAGRAAFWIGFRLFALGEAGRASGWLARAQRLTDGQDCVERGYLDAARSFTGTSPPAIRRRRRSRPPRRSRSVDRFRDADLVAFARGLQGRALVRQGQIDAGLALLDEAMVAATSGELSQPILVGLIYCSAIASCQRVFAIGRAREWTSALAAWCDAQPQLVVFTGTCLVHRAEILQLGGAWRRGDRRSPPRVRARTAGPRPRQRRRGGLPAGRDPAAARRADRGRGGLSARG